MAGRKVQVFQTAVFQHRFHMPLHQTLVAAEQGGMEQDAQEPAVLPVKRIPVVHLAGVDHQGILFFKNQPPAVDVIAHRSFQYMDPFQVLMPVAGSAHVRIDGQVCGADVEGNPSLLIRYDFGEIRHQFDFQHIYSSFSHNWLLRVRFGFVQSSFDTIVTINCNYFVRNFECMTL